MGVPARQSWEPAVQTGCGGFALEAGVQVDVAAVNWEERRILLGECKWGGQPVDRQVVRELVERKTPRVKRALPDEGEGWVFTYAVFTRSGFTPAALDELVGLEGVAVDLERLDAELG